MARIVVVGGGIAGLTTSLLLARDGHHVTVLERDPAPPPAPAMAFDSWERRSVPQFVLPHAFLPRFRQLLDDELPDVNEHLLAAGAARINRIGDLPLSVSGGFRSTDSRFDQITGRRPMVEAVLAGVVEREVGVTVRRGAVVQGLTAADGRSGGVPQVTGVALAGGEHLRADLVVDASGRRSTLPERLQAIGAVAPPRETADGDFVYYCRHFRSTDGSTPAPLGPTLQPYGSVSFALLAADNGHWSIAMAASSRDRLLRRASDADVWTRIVTSFPMVAHWADAEPTTGVQVMARTPDRRTRFVSDGRPVATGFVAIGDASVCTTPAYGRGATFAAMQAVCVRDVLRDVSPGDPVELAHRWYDRVGNVVNPLVDDTLALARHRLAEMEAEMVGRRYVTEDAGWHFGQALACAAANDPELLRAVACVAGVLERGVDIARRPGLVERLRALGKLPDLPGPSRAELEEIVAGRASAIRRPAGRRQPALR